MHVSMSACLEFPRALTLRFLSHLQAWEDTYAKWDNATKQILNFPKNKADDGQVSTSHTSALVRSV